MNAREKIEKADRIIIATDNDEPGKILAEEIVRRYRGEVLGCSTMMIKDANEVLTKKGAEALSSTLVRATPWPVSGIRDAKEFRSIAMSLYEDGKDEASPWGSPTWTRSIGEPADTSPSSPAFRGQGRVHSRLGSVLTWRAGLVGDQ